MSNRAHLNENASMRAVAKILRARASEHPCNFCEQLEQRSNFASTFKLNETILHPSVGQWLYQVRISGSKLHIPRKTRIQHLLALVHSSLLQPSLLQARCHWLNNPVWDCYSCPIYTNGYDSSIPMVH